MWIKPKEYYFSLSDIKKSEWLTIFPVNSYSEPTRITYPWKSLISYSQGESTSSQYSSWPRVRGSTLKENFGL